MNCRNRYLVSQGCIKPFCDLLVCPDPRIVIVCLEGLENILKVGEADKINTDVNQFAQMIDDAEGLEKIENLQSHENSEIYEKVLWLLLHLLFK
jgi:importin subunit alpha-6/7